MIDINESINPVNNAQEAVQELVGEQFLEWLRDQIRHQMPAWPVVADLARLETSPSKIKKFMLQRFLAEQAFLGTREGDPGLLRFAIANLSESDDPQAESALAILEQRYEFELAAQEQRGKSWDQLLAALGASADEIRQTEPKEPTRNYIAELSDICSNSEWQTALGTIAAYDLSVTEEYQALIGLVKKNTLLTDKNLAVLGSFAHDANQTDSRHILDKIIFDESDKRLIWDGVQKQLAARSALLAGLAKYLT